MRDHFQNFIKKNGQVNCQPVRAKISDAFDISFRDTNANATNRGGWKHKIFSCFSRRDNLNHHFKTQVFPEVISIREKQRFSVKQSSQQVSALVSTP